MRSGHRGDVLSSWDVRVSSKGPPDDRAHVHDRDGHQGLHHSMGHYYVVFGVRDVFLRPSRLTTCPAWADPKMGP